MLQIRLTLLFAVVGVLSSIAIAQAAAIPAETTSVDPDSRVLRAPYSAQRRFTVITTLADGTTSRSESGGSEARDSQGRTYSAGERHWTLQEGKKSVLKTEMLMRISDPVANTETRWDSGSKEVKVIHWTQSEHQKEGSRVSAATLAAFDPKSGVEKLGNKVIAGVVAEGTRSSYTVPAGRDHHEQPIVVVHESWYCPELKIVVLESNDDPRSGRTRNELVDVVRGEPDVTRYRPPADYVVHEIQVPR